MCSRMNALFIVDGSSMVRRAYHVAVDMDMTSPSGEPTKATYIFTRMLFSGLRDFRPRHFVFALDSPTHILSRRQIYPLYKVRPLKDDVTTGPDFEPQLKRILEILTLVGISIVQYHGYEADDVIATIAKKASRDTEVVIVGLDKDFAQCVNDRVLLYNPTKRVYLDREGVMRWKGFPPEVSRDVQALTGDDGDNVPGVPGIGDKTAAKLLAKYGDLTTLYSHLNELTPPLRENLERYKQQVFDIALPLVTLVDNLPIEVPVTPLTMSETSFGYLRKLFLQLGFDSLLGELVLVYQSLPHS